MKKIMALGLVCCMATFAVHAQKAVTDEQKAVKKEMLEKYDTNHDGKLDKEERSKMTKEDKEKWSKAFPHHKKKSSDESSSESKEKTPDSSK